MRTKKHQILRITSLKFHGTCDAATDDWFYDDKTYANTVPPITWEGNWCIKDF